jgi:hypothetical protein
VFSVANSGDYVLEFSGLPVRWPSDVTIALNGRPALEHHYAAPDTVVRLPLHGPGSFWLTITVEQTASPASIGISDDTRTLGFWLQWMRLVPATPGET